MTLIVIEQNPELKKNDELVYKEHTTTTRTCQGHLVEQAPVCLTESPKGLQPSHARQIFIPSAQSEMPSSNF